MRAKRSALVALGALLSATPVALSEEATPEEAAAPVSAEELADLPPLPPPPQPKSMKELLDLVRQGFEQERLTNQQREQEFLRAKESQAQLLAEVEAGLAQEEALSQRLEAIYNANELTLATEEERLYQRVGELGELFGVVRQVATDLDGQVWDSLISSQLGTRRKLLDRLGRSTEVPATQDLEKLWFEMQREMVEQGEVVGYRAVVLGTDGKPVERDVIRAGPFSAISNGRYLLWESAEQRLRELTRQPPTKYLSTVSNFAEADGEFAPFAVDPSRGSLLNALTDTPSGTERIQQGGAVGYVIIVLGVIALVIGLIRWVTISLVGRRVAAQRTRNEPDSGNPLGRVLQVFDNYREADPETLELKLDEAVMRESAALERFLWLVKTVSVVAPLLGLLGTVTGMIQTFQAITLFGAGDPKMMAGGISEALVTTMLGLTTAIPLVLLYALLMSSLRRITDVLNEQTVGLVALRSEQARG